MLKLFRARSLTGASSSAVTVTALDASSVTVSVDGDGDSVADYTETATWEALDWTEIFSF